MIKRLFGLCALLAVVSVVVPTYASALFMKGDRTVANAKYGYSVAVPKDWVYSETEYNALNGGKVVSLAITQQGDLTSRPSKWVYLIVGSSSAMFGVSPRVAQKLSNEELVDFSIDQNFNQRVDYVVTKTYIKKDGAQNIYVVESSYLVPGSYRVMAINYFEFKNGRVYNWGEEYFTSHASYAPVLQGIIDSLKI